MTADTFRRLALALEGAVEGVHMGHPDFRVNGKVFATLHADDQRGAVKLTPEEQQEFIQQSPGAFAPASGAWGRQGYTNVQLDAAVESLVRGALLLAWQNTMGQPRRRRSATGAGSKASSRRRS